MARRASTSRRISRGGRTLISSPAEFKRWNDLPYGIWTCEDGREVLFNRFYEPIWQRPPDGMPQPADPKEWVSFVKQEWFYSDTTRLKAKAGKNALAAWGISVEEELRDGG